MTAGKGAHVIVVGNEKGGTGKSTTSMHLIVAFLKLGRSVASIDLESEKVVASFNTLKKMGLNPNSIVLLPRWNHLAGH